MKARERLFCFSEVCLRCRLVLPLFCRRCPAGRCAFLVSGCHCLPLAFLPPIPPTPLPQRGRGRFIVILCKGLRPLHPRGLNPGGTGGRGRTTRSVVGVLSLSPVATAFNWFSCPLSPRPPSPAGKGEIQGYFMQGATPLASPGLNPRGTGKGGEPRARRGACLFCRLPTLP